MAKSGRWHANRHKGESGEVFARLVFLERWGLPVLPSQFDGTHGPDLLFRLDRRDLAPELDPFCGPGVLSLLMLEVKSGVGLLKRRNVTTLLAGKGAGRQMAPAWRATHTKRFRQQGGAVARCLRGAGEPIPGMVIFDATVGFECLALVRINHWATRETTHRLIMASAATTPGFGEMARRVWPHAPTVMVTTPPYLAANAERQQRNDREPAATGVAPRLDGRKKTGRYANAA